MNVLPNQVGPAKLLMIRDENAPFGLRTDTPFDLGDWNGIPSFHDVTVPNIASLMFLVKAAYPTYP
jgi:hypothetical protein